MTAFDVTRLTAAGTALILVPVADSFAGWDRADQLAAAAGFRRHAERGGLTGVVVPVWRTAAGRAAFLVPGRLRAAVAGMTWEDVLAGRNYRVTITRPAAHPRLGRAEPVRVG